MVITQKALEKFIKTPQHLEALTNQKITEIESFELREDDPFVVIGKVLTREDHPNSDHLNLTTVDVGNGEVLHIVCGAKNVDANQTVIVAKVGATLPGNFEIKEAVIRGEKSSGMICSLKELGFSDKVIPDDFKDGIYYFSESFEPGYSGYDALGQTGFKMELSLTPNRGDLLSILGYAYDLSAMLNMKIQLPTFDFQPLKKDHQLKVSIQSDACYRYFGRVFENVSIKESPWWLKSLLIDNDIRPINNVVDITNYALLLVGTPLHTFDLKKLNHQEIVIRQANEDEKVVTLDGKERTLIRSDLVIANGQEAVALAGVMGLENTMVSEHTTSIFLEAALFDPSSINQTSKRLDLKSDSSLRFERGVGFDRVELGLNIATQLLIELAGATLVGKTAYDERKIKRPEINISFQTINEALGLHLSNDEIINYLLRLRFDVTMHQDHLVCTPPDDRYDIHIEADIVEEVGRIYGLDLIPSTPLKTSLEGKLSFSQQKTRQLESLLTSLGLQQVITYSLRKKEEYETFHQMGEKVELLYPLSEDRKLLRQSLYGGLLDTFSYNQNRQLELNQIFEIGHVFSQNQEKNVLGMMLKETWIENKIQKQHLQASFYTLKAILKQVLEVLGHEIEIVERENDTNYHPYQAATILLSGQEVGHFGKLHPVLTKAYDLKDVYASYLDLDQLLNKQETKTYQSISKYPSVERDLAFLMPKDMSVKNVIELMQQTLKKYLVDVYVFDVYQGEHVSPEHKSVAFRMILNDEASTLTNEDVDKLIKKVIHRCQFELKLEIR